MIHSGTPPNQHTESDDEVLLFESSPFGNLDAIVQHDGRVVYFYLSSGDQDHSNPFPSNQVGIQACWVRNLVPGPYVLDEDGMRDGTAPLLPRTHCKSPNPGPLPQPDHLKVVWFEEGNGAALVELPPDSSARTLAVIPPWSGMEGFRGYALECASESPLCWPMPANPNLQQRIDRAAEFWQSFSSTPDPFAALQPLILRAYDLHFGSSASAEKQTNNPARSDHATGKSDYFAIDGDRFPPRGLIHYRTGEFNILATVAMSLCPQPTVEMFSPTPAQDRRIELAIALPLDFTAAQIQAVAGRISSLAAYPWQQFSWFGHGHTCNFSNVIANAESALFVHDRIRNPGHPIELPEFRGDPVNLLWLIPLDSQQRPCLQPLDFSIDQFLSPSATHDDTQA